MEFLQLDPAIHSVWSTPTTLRFGIDRERVTLDEPAARTERLIAALRNGMPVDRFDGVAQALGVNRTERSALIEQLEPVLTRKSIRAAASPLSIVVQGAPDLSAPLARVLAAAGHLDHSEHTPDLAVLIEHFAVPLSRSRAWLTGGIPHLPVVFSETEIRIGPLVRTGGNPCLFCVERTRADRDPAWPAIASQCLGRTSALAATALALHAAATVTQLATRLQCGDASIHSALLTLRPDPVLGVAVTVEQVSSHSACDCALGDASTEFSDEG